MLHYYMLTTTLGFNDTTLGFNDATTGFNESIMKRSISRNPMLSTVPVVFCYPAVLRMEKFSVTLLLYFSLEVDE